MRLVLRFIPILKLYEKKVRLQVVFTHIVPFLSRELFLLETAYCISIEVGKQTYLCCVYSLT